MSYEPTRTLGALVDAVEVHLGRGAIISAKDIAAVPGEYPIYSSSAKGSGEFGRYGKYMFDEELITWSIDGGGRPFYRPRHRFSVTNVCGYLQIVDPRKWNYRYLHTAMERQHARITFDYQMKAHPSVIRDLYHFTCPPLPEQRHIAEILDTLDEAIRKTEQVIAKLQQMKQGLLHDLLTRGIDDNGELRDPDRHPEQFKDSPLGRIPREWEVLQAEDYCHSVADGTHDTPRQTSVGRPLITSKNLKDGNLDWKDVTYISEADYRAVRARSWLRPGDILFGMIGTIGNPVALKEGEHEIAPKNVGLFRLGGDQIKARWLLAVLDSQTITRQLAEAMAGSTQKFVGLATLRRLLVPAPSSAEATRISAAVALMLDHRESEQRGLDKLRTLKHGLMDDLLTGRVRVPVAEDAAR